MSKHNNQSGPWGKNNSGSNDEIAAANQAEERPPNDQKQGAKNQEPSDKTADKSSEKAAENSQAKSADKQQETGPGDSAAQGQTAEKEKTPAEKIADLEAKLAEANDLYLRKAADFENFRKRMNREKQDAIEYANQSLLLDLIVTMDDFERALKSADSGMSAEFKAFYEGVSLIEKRLSTQLENKWGLKRYNSAGQLFDPNLHEAIQMEKSADVEEPTVAEEYVKGYTLKDRVIRHAKVKVFMPEKNTGEGASGGAVKENGQS
ncbi:MAG: nucleotide exchange factor GrpE [Treponema sp.]|nr:nucleotide exchange factor GrpE [Treponema sp.]